MNIAVLGCGNMASQLVIQMHKANKNIQFFTYTPSKTKAKILADKVNGHLVNSLSEFNIDEIDYWLVGCKPQQVKDLAEDFHGQLENKIIVSMLAATNINKISTLFKTDNIIRIMPNTPIGLGQGITLVNVSKNLNQTKKENFINTLKDGSYIIETKSENEIDELTVFSGSGPAYIFNFAYSLEKKLVSMGYEEVMARELINKLFVGSSMLMKESSLSLTELITQVTSKGGVTIEAIKTYRLKDLDGISSLAIDNALLKTYEITRSLA